MVQTKLTRVGFATLLLLALLFPKHSTHTRSNRVSRQKKFTQAIRIMHKGQLTDALSLFLQLIKKNNQDRIAAYALALAGQIYLKQLKPPLAQTQLHSALYLAKKQQNSQLIQFTLFHLAVCDRLNGDLNAAIAKLKIAQKIAEKLKDIKKKLQTTKEIVRILVMQKRWQRLLYQLTRIEQKQSVARYAAQIALSQTQNRAAYLTAHTIIQRYLPATQFETQLLLAETHLALDKMKKVVQFLSRTKTMHIPPQLRTRRLILKSRFLKHQGKPYAAVQLLTDNAIKINRRKKAQLLNQAGVILFQYAQYKQAGKLFQQAKRIAPNKTQGPLLINMARLYLFQGNITKALTKAQQAFTLFSRQYNSVGKAQASHLIVNLLVRKNQFQAARRWANKITKKIAHPNASLLNALGEIYFKSGNLRKAHLLFKRATLIATHSKALREKIFALNFLGLLHKKQGKTTQALKYYQQAIKLNQSLFDPVQRCVLLHNLGILYLKQKRYSLATNTLARTVQLLTKIRSGLFGKLEDRAYFTAENLNSYRFLSLSYILQGELRKAWLTAERAHARSFYERLVQREIKKEGLIQRLSHQLLKIQSQKKPSKRAAKSILKKLHNATTRFTKSQKELPSPRLIKQNIYKKFATVLAEKKIIAVHYSAWEGDKPTLGYIFSPDGIRLFSAGSSAKIEQLTKQFRQIVSKPLIRRVYQPKTFATRLIDNRQIFLKSGKELFKKLLDPVLRAAKKHGSKTIMIIPDGPLDLLPFAALPLPGSKINNFRYFGCNVPFFMAQSASIFLHLQKRGRNQQQKTKSFLGIGNIGEQKVKIAKNRTRFFPALPYSKKELLTISNRLKKQNWHIKKLLGKAATKNSLLKLSKKQQLKKFSLIHFATHSFFDPVIQTSSGILLSGQREAGKILTPKEVLALNLQHNNIILSSCSSAIGKKIKGEGMKNFIRAFLYAGAAQVTASLWPVYDKSTSFYMDYFYKMLLKGNTTSQAHHKTRRYMQNATWQWPCYWAAFLNYGAP